MSSEKIGVLGSVYAIPWLFHLGYTFGAPLLFELIYERGPIWGLLKWYPVLMTLELCLGPVFLLGFSS